MSALKVLVNAATYMAAMKMPLEEYLRETMEADIEEACIQAILMNWGSTEFRIKQGVRDEHSEKGVALVRPLYTPYVFQKAFTIFCWKHGWTPFFGDPDGCCWDGTHGFRLPPSE